MNRIGILITSALLFATPVLAQEQSSSSPTPTIVQKHIQILSQAEGDNAVYMAQDGPSPGAMGVQVAIPGSARQGVQIALMEGEIALDREPVKNAPYTATAVTETTQTLADGTHITHKTSASLARDSQGRTRREETLGKIGPLNVESPKLVFINDPVTHTSYILQPSDKTAQTARTERISVRNGETQIVNVETKTFAAKVGRISDDEWPRDSVKREDLGSQEIEGVNSQGQRETVTIPTGTIGNDRPLEITSENWYSPELHTVVLRKHSDPRFGETLYRLTEVKLGEPDASLFQVPADYKAITKPGFTHRVVKPEPRLPNE